MTCRVWAGWALVLAGPPVRSPGQSQPATGGELELWELPAAVREALAQVRDFAFDFDQPAFYTALAFVKSAPHSPGFLQTPQLVSDWRDLLERPNDFRGRPVTVQGVVGRSKAPYVLASRPDLGQLWQVELRRDDQPLTCTLILTESSADIPLGAWLTVTGYFLMIRQYHGRSGRVWQAALLVAPGPTAIGQAAVGVVPDAGPDWRWLAGALALGLAVTALLVWRGGRTASRSYGTLRASRQAPICLADDLVHWAQNQPDLAGQAEVQDGESHSISAKPESEARP